MRLREGLILSALAVLFREVALSLKHQRPWDARRALLGEDVNHSSTRRHSDDAYVTSMLLSSPYPRLTPLPLMRTYLSTLTSYLDSSGMGQHEITIHAHRTSP